MRDARFLSNDALETLRWRARLHAGRLFQEHGPLWLRIVAREATPPSNPNVATAPAKQAQTIEMLKPYRWRHGRADCRGHWVGSTRMTETTCTTTIIAITPALLVACAGSGGVADAEVCPASRSLSALGAPCRIRTCDLRIRSPLLYPAELRARADWIPCGARRRQSAPRPSSVGLASRGTGGRPRASGAQVRRMKLSA